MRQELDRQLRERHPEIFASPESTSKGSVIIWGIECADGWFDILDKLCSDIQAHINLTGSSQVIARQIKEKYGGLRFYYSGADLVVDQLIDEAEELSEVTCDCCGAPGTLTENANGWLRTRCQKHQD